MAKAETVSGKFTKKELAVLRSAVDKMDWDDINAFHAELRKGQSVFEDAGGYMLRAIGRLFGLPSEDREVVSYKKAANAIIERK